MNNFWKRTATAVIFVIVLLAAIWHPVSCVILFSMLAVLSVYEFYSITRNDTDSHVNKIGGMLLAATLMTGVPAVFAMFNAATSEENIHYLNAFLFFNVLIYIALWFALLIFELFRNKGNALKNWAYLIMGQMFFALPWCIAAILPFFNYNASFDHNILYALFFTIWLNDTGAYLCGCTLGKHKFFERISPKKTWEGFAGGALLAILAGAFVFPHLFGKGQIFWLLFTLIAVVFGTLGDLIESLIKRSVGVKDSGNILPGHGGILDRFDSFMFAAPAIFIYISIYYVIL
ncbi:MAG: phosphatidate cytidylyltransferase [Bacteroidales bacterium]|nr:phosphatidate cytidylyltransferase [Bacteroidales bacterium]